MCYNDLWYVEKAPRLFATEFFSRAKSPKAFSDQIIETLIGKFLFEICSQIMDLPSKSEISISDHSYNVS